MIDMIPYTIRFEDTTHRKLKVIASHYGASLNKYLLKIFDKEISEWEQTHGEIEIPE